MMGFLTSPAAILTVFVLGPAGVWCRSRVKLQEEIWKLLPADCATFISCTDLCAGLLKETGRVVAEKDVLRALRKMKKSKRFPTKSGFRDETCWRRSKRSIQPRLRR